MRSGHTSSFIYGAARTPVGNWNGALAAVPAPELASFAIKAAVQRSRVSHDNITDLILGNVLSSGLGQAPARQAAIKSGLAPGVHAMIVNKVCGSGLQAVILADQMVRLKESGFVVAGGMENMSRAPYLAGRKAESGGDRERVDSLVHDGLWDSFSDCHMGAIAEKLAKRGNYSRDEQDMFAMESYLRAREAQDQCRFSKEIVPIPVFRNGEKILLDKDEGPYAHDLKKLFSLPPAFEKNEGTITAGNASSINDGAAALIIGPWEADLKPLARIVTSASVSVEPDQFPLAPVDAIEQVLKQWPVSLSDIDLFEINEAFAVTTLAVSDMLGIDRTRLNVNGGAVALGHPIGASGARILVTLLYALAAEKAGRGIAAICIGGGEAVAVGIERLDGEM